MNEKTDPQAASVHPVVMRRFEHPWTQQIGWVTEVWETPSHERSELVAVEAATQGWHIWLVANEGQPSIVVYRESDIENADSSA